MNRVLLAVLLCSCSFPSWSSAMDIKNIRKSYGPLGAERKDTKCIPGDIFFMTFDIEDLALDKTGKASITITFEFFDPQGKKIFEKATPKDVVPQLGGARIPGDVHVALGPQSGAWRLQDQGDRNGPIGEAGPSQGVRTKGRGAAADDLRFCQRDVAGRRFGGAAYRACYDVWTCKYDA